MSIPEDLKALHERVKKAHKSFGWSWALPLFDRISTLTAQLDAAKAENDRLRAALDKATGPVTDEEAKARAVRWQMAVDNQVETLDSEVIPLCKALNSLSGIETISSCCGHGYAPFRVYFTAANLDSLRPILEVIDESEIWSMRTSMATGNMEIYFVLDAPKESYSEANTLADALLAARKEHGNG